MRFGFNGANIVETGQSGTRAGSGRGWRMRNYFTTLPAILLLLAGCQTAGDTTPEESPAASSTITALDAAIDAHGGLDRWRSFGTLEFDLTKGESIEHHVVDLHSRLVRVETEDWTIGFNGADVWISPGMDAYGGSPRFYSSLQFYFFGLPFLLADPGTIHEDLGLREMGDETYRVVKVGFEPSVGDSPDDFYLAHIDTASGLMEALLYTVTFRSGEPNENYSARMYEWQEVQGLMVPAKMSSYRWNAEESRLGDHRSDGLLSNVVFRTDRPDPALFAMPDGAEIDPPPAAANAD